MQTFDFVSSYSYFEANFPVFKKCRGIYVAKILGYNLEFYNLEFDWRVKIFDNIGKKIYNDLIIKNKKFRFIPENIKKKEHFKIFKNLSFNKNPKPNRF